MRNGYDRNHVHRRNFVAALHGPGAGYTGLSDRILRQQALLSYGGSCAQPPVQQGRRNPRERPQRFVAPPDIVLDARPSGQ